MSVGNLSVPTNRKCWLTLFLLAFFASDIVCSAVASSVDTITTYTIFAEWIVLDYLWDTTHTKETYLATGDFSPSNNALAGINVDNQGNIYVTVPRY
jgi:hypothetical protein